MYGEWFGRPLDNQHTIVDVSVENGDVLVLSFNEGEALHVWSPQLLTTDPYQLRIDRADQVRWDWYSYGSPQVEANHQWIDHRVESRDSDGLWLVSEKGHRKSRRRVSDDVPAVSIASWLGRVGHDRD
ncbi:hypothetical protein ATK17_1365 [Branchiibius hedensis]|uniref:Uncharacterized protein n=2 Tax=Branchiibius hedensis TaxID=672460 RepID=A0A2Y8ZQE0_9MICO|nr:hypothetical protein ATK17_1365 [Branchiibius hedensis]SSA34064.1 hypothetical protein SAMN04489750_1365 [Branchiibius hedensis]